MSRHTKKLILLLSLIFISQSVFATDMLVKNSLAQKTKTINSQSWVEFEKEFLSYKDTENKIGISYLVSGSLVVLGSLSGYQSTNDSAVKLVYGILQGLGLGAMGVGLYKINGQSEWSSFYKSIKSVDLPQEQKDHMVKVFLESERERKNFEKNIAIATHLLAGALGVYSADREKDPSTQSAFYLLAGIHAVLALSYTF